MLIEFIFYILLGYFSGGLMFGYVIPKVIKGIDVRSMSSDGNPGTANAFFYRGAVWNCGTALRRFKGTFAGALGAEMSGT